VSGAKSVILASASVSRARILRGVGLDFTTQPAAIDEAAIKDAMTGAAADAIAAALAEAKALSVSRRYPNSLVIGADQMLECDGRLFDKPRDRAEARRHLLTLRERTHTLIAAACVAIGEAVVWRGLDHARLTMRDFSDRFLDNYLDEAGDTVLGSVGAYRVEEQGIQLFSLIDGEHFTILGLPLLDLLEFLRSQEVVLE
jgi:septum formation protein